MGRQLSSTCHRSRVSSVAQWRVHLGRGLWPCLLHHNQSESLTGPLGTTTVGWRMKICPGDITLSAFGLRFTAALFKSVESGQHAAHFYSYLKTKWWVWLWSHLSFHLSRPLGPQSSEGIGCAVSWTQPAHQSLHVIMTPLMSPECKWIFPWLLKGRPKITAVPTSFQPKDEELYFGCPD